MTSLENSTGTTSDVSLRYTNTQEYNDTTSVPTVGMTTTVETTTGAPPSTTPHGDSGSPVGAIVGGVIGGIVVVAVVVVLIIVLLKKRNGLSCCHKKSNPTTNLAPSISTVDFHEGKRVQHQTSYTSETGLISSSGSSNIDIHYSLDIPQELRGFPKERTGAGGHAVFTIPDDDEDGDDDNRNNPSAIRVDENGTLQDVHNTREVDKADAGISETYDVLPPTGSRPVSKEAQSSKETYYTPMDLGEGLAEDTYDITTPSGDTYDIDYKDNIIASSASKMAEVKTADAKCLQEPPKTVLAHSSMPKVPTYANFPKLHLAAPDVKKDCLNKDTDGDPEVVPLPEKQNKIAHHAARLDLLKPESEDTSGGDPQHSKKPGDPSYSNFEMIQDLQMTVTKRNS